MVQNMYLLVFVSLLIVSIPLLFYRFYLKKNWKESIYFFLSVFAINRLINFILGKVFPPPSIESFVSDIIPIPDIDEVITFINPEQLNMFTQGVLSNLLMIQVVSIFVSLFIVMKYIKRFQVKNPLQLSLVLTLIYIVTTIIISRIM